MVASHAIGIKLEINDTVFMNAELPAVRNRMNLSTGCAVCWKKYSPWRGQHTIYRIQMYIEYRYRILLFKFAYNVDFGDHCYMNCTVFDNISIYFLQILY